MVSTLAELRVWGRGRKQRTQYRVGNALGAQRRDCSVRDACQKSRGLIGSTKSRRREIAQRLQETA